MKPSMGRQVRFHSAAGEETATVAHVYQDGATVNLSVLDHGGRQRRETDVKFHATAEGRWWEWPVGAGGSREVPESEQRPRGSQSRAKSGTTLAPAADEPAQPKGSETASPPE